jgi:hypothetical protein
MALDPRYVPEPPYRPQARASLPWLGWVAVVALAAAVSIGLALMLLYALPHGRMQAGAAADRAQPGAEDPVRARRAALARLIVENKRGYANEPLPLGVSLNGASGDELVTLVGLARGTRLSAGMPLGLTGWQVAGRDLGKALALAPKDYVGVMDAAIDLRSSTDRLMDSRIVRLEWLPKKQDRQPPPGPRIDPAKVGPAAPTTAPAAKRGQAVQSLDPDELATLLRRGQELLMNGDIASARLVLRRAADAGNAQAALALGASFDPSVLSELGVIGFAPNPSQARLWYRRAADNGSREAARRLERLPAGAD